MGVMLAYGILNITVTKVTGKPVYSPLSWNSFLSWCIGLALIPVAFGIYAFWYYLARWKFRKLKMETNEVMF